mgnify:CR=1 FL=1
MKKKPKWHLQHSQPDTVPELTFQSDMLELELNLPPTPIHTQQAMKFTQLSRNRYMTEWAYLMDLPI